MRQIKHNGVLWTDYHKITEKQVLELKEKFNLPFPICEELIPRQSRARIEEYPTFLYLILHFPVHNKESRETKPAELDIIISGNEIVTSHMEKIPALEAMFEGCADHDEMKQRYCQSVGFLLFSLLDGLVDSALPMIDHIGENIEKIEDGVFKGREREMLREIAVVKRDIIDSRQAIKPQKSVLDVLAKKASRLFGHNLDFLAQEVVGSNLRVWNALESQKELIESLEETNNSLLSHQISDIMKILTLVSFITFPLSVIAGLFGMNVYDSVGFVKNPNTWWIVLSVMFIVALTMIVYFRKKKWF